MLTEINGTQITYDEIGNPLYIGVDPDTLIIGQSLTWEGRQLVQYQEVDFWFGEIDGTLSTTTYQYNADGIRTSKTVNGVLHEYVLNGSQILAEKVGNSLYVYLYDESGSPIGFRYRTSSYAADVFDTYFFEKNLQGDIIAIYNQSGVKIGSYKYDAYGAVTTTVHNSSYSSIVNSNPFRYRGYYYDTESGYYYLQSRYYNPTWGRFINADSALYSHLLGYNMFAYCYNNPANYYDPYGESATKVLTWWFTAGGAVAVAEPTPIGEVVYFIGLVVFGSIVAIEAVIIGEQLAENIRDAVDPAPEEESNPEVESSPKDNSSDQDDSSTNSQDKDRRLKGKPGDVNKEGSSETKIGDDGRAYRERHHTDHGNPKKHSNPHDHDITWSEDGHPIFGPPINYWGEVISIF